VLNADVRREELRAVLAGDPALGGLLAAARDRYIATGSWTSSIALETRELREAAAALGIAKLKDRLSMKVLTRALQRTRFQCNAEEAVRWAFDGVPPTRDEAATERGLRWESQRSAMITLAGAAATEVAAWLAMKPGSLKRAWVERATLEEGRLAVRAAAATRDLAAPEIIPVLANRLSGDPHALDVGRHARRYFERILLCRHADLGLQPPLRAADRAALLAASHLAADGISSQVWAIGLMGTDAMLSEARRLGHVIGLPLITLNAIADVSAFAGAAFAVENRSVFGAMVPMIAGLPVEQRPTLICTSGNPSLAARLLLRRLADAGVTIHYGGDTDARGLAIARTIEAIVGSSYRPWHMNAADTQVRYQESSLGEMLKDLAEGLQDS
jgi:uncharacterized protein (TIGR02679 family)